MGEGAVGQHCGRWGLRLVNDYRGEEKGVRKTNQTYNATQLDWSGGSITLRWEIPLVPGATGRIRTSLENHWPLRREGHYRRE